MLPASLQTSYVFVKQKHMNGYGKKLNMQIKNSSLSKLWLMDWGQAILLEIPTHMVVWCIDLVINVVINKWNGRIR